jgi:hypothetical protein
VLREYSTVQLSFRIPPTLNPRQAADFLKEFIEKCPPFGAKVTFEVWTVVVCCFLFWFWFLFRFWFGIGFGFSLVSVLFFAFALVSGFAQQSSLSPPTFATDHQIKKASTGWNAPEMAPWLVEACNASSSFFYKRAAGFLGEGGSV